MNIHNPGTDVSHVRNAEYESITQAIVASVASLEDCPRTDLPELFETVEPDALNRLFEGCDETEDLTVELSVDEYRVTCEKGGDVTSERIQ